MSNNLVDTISPKILEQLEIYSKMRDDVVKVARYLTSAEFLQKVYANYMPRSFASKLVIAKELPKE